MLRGWGRVFCALLVSSSLGLPAEEMEEEEEEEEEEERVVDEGVWTF